MNQTEYETKDLVMKIEGERGKRFRVYWCNIKNEPHEIDGEYDTIAEVRAHRWQLDRHYKISVNRKFLTRTEFEEWAKKQEEKKLTNSNRAVAE